jgi:hypothetical protein
LILEGEELEMKAFKKIVAWAAAIVSVIGVLVVVAGLVGSWVLYSQLTATTVKLLTAGENIVLATSEGVNRIDARLDVSQQRINTVDEKVIALGQELADTSLLVTAIDKTIGDELYPILESVSDTAVTIRETAASIDNAIQAINDIPFVSLEGIFPDTRIFAAIADSITAIETTVAETRMEVQARREDRAGALVDIVIGKSDELRGLVTGAQSTLGDADARLAESSANLAELKISLPRTFMMITLALNLVLLLVAIAFVSLFFHGLSYIKNTEQSLKELLL